MNSSLIEAIDQFSKIKGCRFISLTYTNKQGETARHTIMLGVDRKRAYKRDLSLYQHKLKDLKGLQHEACQELIDSLKESLTLGIGNNTQNTRKDTFDHLDGNLKWHRETGELYINGFSRSKVVLREGEYKEVKSKPLTIEKNALRKLGKLGKFREFKLNQENVKSIKLNHNVLEID